MKSISLTVTFIFIFCLVKAQSNEAFIYGTITTIDDKSYTGVIRWGDEEVFWTDFFNANKPEHKYKQYIDEGSLVSSIQKWFSWDSDEEKESEKKEAHTHTIKDLVHVWVCQFGDIRSLKITGMENVALTLKNGETVRLDGGSNDFGAEINILDENLGELSLKWDRINTVSFKDTPSGLTHSWGRPIFGTVQTNKGDFTGFIQWDHDERLTTDKLDGQTEDGEISIDFGNISSIEKNYSGSNITLASGRTVQLHGSNDVNKENRGIIVTLSGLGRVDIPWSNFIRLDMKDAENNKLPGYSYFKAPKEINGKVISASGQTIAGRLAFDLDEEYDFEMIQGKDDDLQYSVIIKYISKIEPKNFSYSQITLKNGNQLLIGDSHDVSDTNSGILVFEKGKDEPTHVKWKDVQEVIFN